jgi:hypothetical protein
MKLIRNGLGLGLLDDLGKLDKQKCFQINVSQLNLLVQGLAQLLPATIEDIIEFEPHFRNVFGCCPILMLLC